MSAGAGARRLRAPPFIQPPGQVRATIGPWLRQPGGTSVKAVSRCKVALSVVCTAIAALAGGANAPDAIELDEVNVTGVRERERRADPARPVVSAYEISVQQDDPVAFQIEPWAFRQPELLFRRSSVARQGNGLPPNSSLSADRLVVPWSVVPNSLPVLNIVKLRFTLASNVAEADGLPASIPFGPHSSLVNLDYVLLRVTVPDTNYRPRFVTAGETTISLPFAIHPQTRRCERDLLLVDEGSTNPLRLILITDSNAECLRAEKRREGDLIFADSVPEPLRQAVRETYEPIAARLANRLGSEPGQVFVAWLPDSPHRGYRFEQSWNRNNLLLFNGAAWQQGADPAQRESLRADFVEEQIRRRIRQTDVPGAFTESAVRYLVRSLTAERSGDMGVWLAQALPVWIEGCAGDLENKAIAAAHGDVSSIACGLVLQFVYDAVARARSAGRTSLSDTWRSLLGASYRRNESGVKPLEFLASSRQAQGIAQGLLDGSMDWSRFAAQMEDLGVQLLIEPGARRPAVTVVSLMHFDL
jgi:hypothetical protein